MKKKSLIIILITLIIITVSIILFVKFSNKEENISKEENNIKEEQKIEKVYVNLHLNMRLMPLDRGYVFEDPINEDLQKRKIGEVTGGGTALSEEGMPTSCDIEIYIDYSKKQEFIEYIKNQKNIAKGSYLEFDDEKVEIGDLEGLNIMLDGTGLPSSIYKENDVNDIIEDMNNLLKEKGEFYSYYYGERYTNLYFYGESFEEMKQIIEEYAKSCPLCQQSIIEKI